MKFWNWKNWGIRPRMFAITILPVTMIISVVLWTYFSRLDEVQRDLEERGNLVAGSLAESSQYGVISGNLSYIDGTIRGLLQRDRTIYKIEILDQDMTPLMSQLDDEVKDSENRVFVAPIRKDLVAVNSFGVDDAPHVSGLTDARANDVTGFVIGYVQVTMSPSTLLESKRHRILIGTSFALIFLLISGIVGYVLGRGLTLPLANTIAAIRTIREGNYDIDLKVTAGGEIGELQATIVEMAEGLDTYKKDLEGLVQTRTRALAEARDDAVRSDAEKRRLIQKVNSIVEEERKSIAIEIHDHLNATLIVIRLAAKRIVDLASKKSLSHQDEIKEHADSVIEHTAGLYNMARDIVKKLRPEVIDTLGLREGIEEMVRHYDTIHPKCRFSVNAVGDFTGLNSDLAITAYRLVQEALSNVVKHSEASEAFVLLHLCPDRANLRVEIRDNGKGFNTVSTNPGIGLIGMKERVFGVGGTLQIETGPATGTVISIMLPVPETTEMGSTA